MTFLINFLRIHIISSTRNVLSLSKLRKGFLLNIDSRKYSKLTLIFIPIFIEAKGLIF